MQVLGKISISYFCTLFVCTGHCILFVCKKRTKTIILCIKRKLHSAHCTYFFSLLNYECLGNLMVWYIPYNGDIMVIYRGEEWYWYWYDIDRNATQKNDIWSDIISDFSEMIWSDIISEKMWYLTPLSKSRHVTFCSGDQV